MYDYFKAKKLFEKSMKKKPAGAAFGLSQIYLNDKNPFHNLDSAYVYIIKSINGYEQIKKRKKKEKLAKLGVDSLAIFAHKNQVCETALELARSINTIESYNHFLNLYTESEFIQTARKERNGLAFFLAKKENTYQAYQAFLKNYPDADDHAEAKYLYDLSLYQILTDEKDLSSFIRFIEEHPESPYVKDAENKIFEIETRGGTVADYDRFIKNYPKNRNINNAWELLYNLYTFDRSPQSFVEFRLDFPDYPYTDQVERDIELSQKVYIKARQNNKWGFIDLEGNVTVPFEFDAVGDFSFGLAEAEKNGKIGFIDK